MKTHSVTAQSNTDDVRSFPRRTFIAAFLAVCTLPSPSHADLRDDFNKLTGQTGTLRVLINDMSASPSPDDSKKLYRESSRKFLAKVDSGDVILLATVSDVGMDRVRTEKIVVNKTGRKFDDRSLKAAAVNTAMQQVEKMLATQDVQQSRYLELFAALAPAIAEARAKGMPVLMRVNGDAIEDSPLSKFDKPEFTDAALDALSKRVAAERLLLVTAPKSANATLSHVEIAMVGTGGVGSQRYQRIERFWRAYFELCGVTLTYYGGTVPG